MKNARGIILTTDSDLIYMSFHAREEAKNWSNISKLALHKNIVIQSAVLSIYATELYLKSLLMILGVNVLNLLKSRDGHNLSMLFKKIPDKSLKYSIASNVINSSYDSCKKINNDPDELLKVFEEELGKISTAYMQYRYLYEKYSKKLEIVIPLKFIFNLNTVLEKESDLIVYQKINNTGEVSDISDPKISYHIINEGWVDMDDIRTNNCLEEVKDMRINNNHCVPIDAHILEKNIVEYDRNRIILIIRDPYNKIIDTKYIEYDKEKYNDINSFSNYVGKRFTKNSFLYCDYDIECKKKYLYEDSKKRNHLDLNLNFSNLKFEDYYNDTNSTLIINSVIFYGGVGGPGAHIFAIIGFLITLKDLILDLINFIIGMLTYFFPFYNIRKKYGYGKKFISDIINYSTEWDYGFMNLEKIKFKGLLEKSVMRKLGYRKKKKVWTKNFLFPSPKDILENYMDC